MPDSDAKVAWIKANTTRVVLKLNHNTDADILAWLEHQPSKQGAIREVLKAYLRASHPEDK